MARPGARGSRGSRVPSFAMLLLANELMRTATAYGIPPVTGIFIAAQVLLFLGYLPLVRFDVWDVCINVEKTVNQGEWKRLVLSAFEHADEWHLYYNMVSFMWKGRSLEKRLGSARFFFTLVVFTLLTGVTYVGLNYLLAEITRDMSYMTHCAVGFSGVIFALKVLTTHFSPTGGRHYFFGIPISSKYAVWSELVLIQLMTPRASFVGHLAGILVGLAYTRGPLKLMMDSAESILNINSNSYHRRAENSSRYPGYESYVPNGLSEEEQIRRATQESLSSSSSGFSPGYAPSVSSGTPRPSAPLYPDLDELRRRRYERYS